MKFFYYALTYYVNRIKILFALNSKKKLLLLLCFISSLVQAEFQSADSQRLSDIQANTHAISTEVTESTQRLSDIRSDLQSIKTYWKPILDSIDQSGEDIKGHTTYFYNVLSSLASAYPTISQTSWFGQVLQEQKQFNHKLQTLIDNPVDLSTVESELQTVNYKLGDIEQHTSELTPIKNKQIQIYDLLYEYLPYIMNPISDYIPIMYDSIASMDSNIYSVKTSNEDILRQLQIGDTNLYNALFNPQSYDTYYSWQDLNFNGGDIDSSLNKNQSSYGGYLTPQKNWSFIQAYFQHQRVKSQQDVQLSKLQNVANLNLQEIRKKGIHDITNLISSQTYTLDQSISNNVNRLIAALQGTGSGEDQDSSLTDIQAKLLTQIIQNENLRDHLYESQMNFSGEFKKDLLRLLRYQTTLDVSQNYAQLSILTNLQCLVVNTIGEQERLQDEFEQGTEAIDKEGKQGLAMFEDNTDLSEHFSINNSVAEDYMKSKDVDFKILKNLSTDKIYFTGFDIPSIRLDPNSNTPLDFEVKVDDTILNYDIFEDTIKYIRFCFTLFNWCLGLYISYLIIGYSFKTLSWCFSLLHGSPVSYSFVSKGFA